MNLRGEIKNKIKKALQEDNIARTSTRWNSDTQPNLYELDIFLRKSGYRLTDIVLHDDTPELLIEAIKVDHLHPEIIHQVDEDVFYIKTKDYGELIVSDLEELIKGYEIAINVVKHLEELDLHRLEFEE